MLIDVSVSNLPMPLCRAPLQAGRNVRTITDLLEVRIGTSSSGNYFLYFDRRGELDVRGHTQAQRDMVSCSHVQLADMVLIWRFGGPFPPPGAVAEHIVHPEDMIYMVSMDGPFYEVNLTTLKATLLFSLVDKLAIPISPDPHTTGQCYPHFKDALTVHASTDGKGGVGPTPGGLVYVASNGYNEKVRRGVDGWNGGGREVTSPTAAVPLPATATAAPAARTYTPCTPRTIK